MRGAASVRRQGSRRQPSPSFRNRVCGEERVGQAGLFTGPRRRIRVLTAIVTVMLTFLLTGILATRLSQAWQTRNWVSQQRLADKEDQYRALEGIFDEVATLASKRQHKMVRLLSVITGEDDLLIRTRFAEYDTALVEWNERLNTLYAKLTIHLRWRFTKRLEDEIHANFVWAGDILERITKRRLARLQIEPEELVSLLLRLNQLQGKIFALNRDILRVLLEQKAELYVDKMPTVHTLDRFPTWELFKALFKPRI
jgi:hypothetical protein